MKWSIELKAFVVAYSACILIPIHLFGQAQFTMYLYTSDDGTYFTNETYFLDSSDVPSLAYHPNGSMVAAYQCFKGGPGSSSWDKIGVRFSTDEGSSWTTHQVISISGLAGTSQRPFDPAITITPDNQYRLYFSYCPNTFVLDSTCDTYSATSSDAINYTLDSGIRFGTLNEKVIDPTVIYFDSLWHYSSPIAPNPPTPVYGGARHATSSDGLNFTFMDTIGYGNPSYKWTGNLLNTGSSIRFYGYGDNSLGHQLWWTESSDGSNWGPYNFTTVTGKDPGILKTPLGQYHLLVPKDSTSQSTFISGAVAPSIQVYPNPFSTSTTIELSSEPHMLSIYNMVGKKLREKEVSGKTNIDRGSLTKGIYIIEVRSENQTYSGKLVLE
jgi:hypothetical protein